MGFLKDPSSFYSGQQCYKYTERLILNGKRILIVSPYIDPYYAKFLSENSGGKKIRVLSSSMDPEAMKILGRRKPLGLLLAVLVIILSSDYLAYSSGLSSILIAIPSVLLILSSFLFFSQSNRDIEVKVPRTFVHAKMYISENAAIHGSANLTYSGMHRNVEHIEITRDLSQVERLRREFQEMWERV